MIRPDFNGGTIDDQKKNRGRKRRRGLIAFAFVVVFTTDALVTTMLKE